MRSLLLLALFVLIVAAPVSQGQDYELPPCSVEDSYVVHKAVFPPYRDLIFSFRTLSTLQGLLDYSETHLRLRNNVFPKLSLCLENFEFGWILAQIADDAVPLYAFVQSDVSRVANPFADTWDQDISRAARWLKDDRASLADQNSSRPASRQDRAEQCSTVDIDMLHSTIIPTFRELVAKSMDSSDLDALLVFVDEVITFRDMLWSDLPRCSEGLELGLMMRQIVSDFVSARALEFAGAATEEILYGHAIQTGMDAFTALSGDLIDNGDGSDAAGAQRQDDSTVKAGEGIALMRVYGSDLSACSAFQASLLAIRLVVHDSVIKRASELESIGDLLAFADEETDQSIWALVPHCAEAVEVSWFVAQLAGDIAAAQALELVGISPDANLYQGQAERGSTRFDEIYAYVHSEGWSEPLKSDDGNLEACTASELASLDDIAWDFEDLLVGPALKIQTSGDVLEYGKAHVQWRKELWTSLPACRESVKLGVLMGTIASDFATAFALSLSGIDTDDNPYMLRALGNWLAFLDQTIMKDFVEASGNAGKTYFVTAKPYADVRSCASTDCAIVGSAQNGEALTVIDDSKD